MSKSRTKDCEAEFKRFIVETKGLSFSKRALIWFQKNLNEIVTAQELARIPGEKGDPINHNIRRIFELRVLLR